MVSLAVKSKIINIIKKGEEFLAQEQQKDGSFLSLSSDTFQGFTKAKKFHSTFSTSLILYCLNNLRDTTVLKGMKQKAIFFLLSQKSQCWSFNYWVRGSKESQEMPYPDDLDDTFCALSALFTYNPKFMDGQALAAIVTLLTNLEDKEGGPYRTWLVTDKYKTWLDVDLAVNSNIAYFLSLQGVNLPNLNQFIESKIKTDNLSSPYYPSVYPLIYFISRFYKQSLKGNFQDELSRFSYNGELAPKLKDILLSHQNEKGTWGNPLNTALAVSSLINLNDFTVDLSQAANYLIKLKDKAWKPYGFCFDPTMEGKVHFSGSAALTAAFCMEALTKYLNNLNQVKSHSKDQQILYQQIVSKVKSKYESMGREINNQAQDILGKVLTKDSSKQITLIPYYFYAALKTKKKVSNKFLIELGSANLFGWISYTIYDNFLDGEGDPKQLSVANIALRELNSIFDNILPERKRFRQLFHKILDDMDIINYWEVTNCRINFNQDKLNLEELILPEWDDYQYLAQRSLGHGLGPIAILLSIGYKINSWEVKSLMQFLNHFLIAKQLNDDAHDWQEDLVQGHISPVVKKLFFELRKEHPEEKVLPKEVLINELQRIFWYKVIKDVCQDILKQTKLAEGALKQIGIVDKTLQELLLSPIILSAEKALYEQKEAIKFLRNYKSQL